MTWAKKMGRRSSVKSGTALVQKAAESTVEQLERRRLLSGGGPIAFSPPLLLGISPASSTTSGNVVPAHTGGLVFNTTFDASVTSLTNAAQWESAFNYATGQFSALFNDPITINITFKANPGTSIFGQSSASGHSIGNYATLKTVLTNDSKSPDDALMLAHLPAVDPTGGANYLAINAQAKALGILAADNAANDGTVTIGEGFNFTFDPNNRAVAGEADFIGIAEHEISEVMGRYGTANLGGRFGPLDLTGYQFGAGGSGFGTLNLTANQDNNYFSLDGGVTPLKLNNNHSNGEDDKDWGSGSNDAFNAFSSSGVVNGISAVDAREMDVIGYDLVQPVGAYLVAGSNVNVSKLPGNQAETTIAMNPNNVNNLFASETDTGMCRYSMDGGATWINSDVSALPITIGDVQTAWDSFGNLFMTRFDSTTTNQTAVIVALSTDGGKTFSNLGDVFPDNSDQPSIAVGPGNSAGTGSVWVSCTNGAGKVVACGAGVSGLGTVGTFSTPQIAGSGDFGSIAVGPSGQVMVNYQDNSTANGPETIHTQLDANGLGTGGFAAAVNPTTTNVGGFSPIPAQPDRMIDAESNLAWDRSGGPHNGRLYLVYVDRPSAITYGTAASTGTTTTIVLQSGSSSVNNFYNGDSIQLLAGPGVASVSTIVAYDGGTRTATVSTAFTAAPTTATTYAITAIGSAVTSGTSPSAGTTTTILLSSSASSVTGTYNGDLIRLTGGTGAGNIATITAYDGATRTATVSPAFSVAPDSTTTYSITVPSASAADTDIYLRHSDNNGATWSSRTRLNDDGTNNGKSQFQPAIAVDQATGAVAVTWYDTRNSGMANNTVQVYGTVSVDGGATWLSNSMISTGTTNATVAAVGGFNLGDYDTMTFNNGVFYRSWADNSNSTGDNPAGTVQTLDLYTAKVTVSSIAAVVTSIAVSGGLSTAVAGTPITYIVTVANTGGATATKVAVSDILSTDINPFSVVFSASDNGHGATGYTARGIGPINDTVTLPAGSSITYTVSGNILSADTGTMTTTASASTSTGLLNTDANVSGSAVTNQSSLTLTLVRQAELGVVMNGANPLHLGQSDVYTIVITNFQTTASGSDAVGATINTDALAQFTGIHFSSAVLYMPDNAVTPTFTNASGTVPDGAAFSDTFNLSSGSIIQFTVTGTIAAGATGTISNTATVADPGVDESATNNASSVTAAVVTGLTGSVVGRGLFYANSFWDTPSTSNPGFTTTPDSAVAADKLALMPGQKARFNNYSSYTSGINGVFVDLTGDTGNISLTDFTFAVGNDNSPALWTVHPVPSSIAVYPGAGVNGSDRVQINFANGTIVGQWLAVTVVPLQLDTNLAVPDVFYFGNAPAEVGDSVTDAFVTSTDDIAARNDIHTTRADPATLENPHDFDRDSKVLSTDEIFARTHHTALGTGLLLITPSTPGVFVVSAQTSHASPAAFTTSSIAPSTVTSAPIITATSTSPNKSGRSAIGNLAVSHYVIYSRNSHALKHAVAPLRDFHLSASIPTRNSVS